MEDLLLLLKVILI